jgi:ABC-type phosphate transport system substrate-binding protein
MIRFGLVAMMLLAACEKTPSKLEGSVKGTASENNDEDTAQLEAALSGLEERIKGLEETHAKGFGTDGTGDASMASRLAKIEANLQRREEALGFLEMAYAQQKRQQEAQEAQEPDPNAVFAVDVSKAVANGQVDGPNSAIITIVEAWDFA